MMPSSWVRVPVCLRIWTLHRAASSIGVSQSTYFLHNVNAYNEGALPRDMVPLRDGEKVGVIGGGNVAMDAARTAIRLGADVTVLYRKTQEEMPAIKANTRML